MSFDFKKQIPLRPLPMVIAFTAMAIMATSCKEDVSKNQPPKQPGKVSEYPRNETLYIGGFEWAPPTTFNPLDRNPNFPTDGNVRLLYESLLTYNQLTASLEPMLADSYTQTDSSITVHLDSDAQWNNGTRITADDVIYTFKIDSILPTVHHDNWQHIRAITDDGNNNITFHLAKNSNLLLLLNAIAEASILPKAVFEPLIKSAKNGKGYNMEKIYEFKNDSLPIASGPYNIKTYSPDKIVLERTENYWRLKHFNGQKPVPRFIIHAIYNSNDHFNNAMVRGNLDVSSSYLPRIWEKAKDSIRAWSREEPYQQPANITVLVAATQKEPFNNVNFRRALAHAINFEKIKARAVSNYSPTIQPGLILPFGAEKIYYSKEDADLYGFSYSTAKARKILKDAGYSWNKEGHLRDKKKKIIRNITIECPQGWTDWNEAINVIVESFAEIGITAIPKFVDYAIWDMDLRRGTFDLSMETPPTDHSVASPWNRFNQLLSLTAYKPVGEESFANHGRFQDTQTNNLLEAIPRITDAEKLQQAYRELNKRFMQTVPVLPVMYRPSTYYQFSTKHWTNFPTAENPYAPPNNLVVAAGVTALWKIRPIEQKDNQ